MDADRISSGSFPPYNTQGIGIDRILVREKAPTEWFVGSRNLFAVYSNLRPNF